MIETLRRAAGFLTRAERRQWLLLIPLSLIAALLETAAAALMWWLIGAVLEPLAPAGSAAAVYGSGVGPAALFERLETVPRWSMAVGIALVFAIKNGVRLYESYARAKIAADTAATIGTRLLGGYLRAPWRRHLDWNSAKLIHSTTAGADVICSTVLVSATAAASELLAVVSVLAVLVVVAAGRVLVLVALLTAAVGLLLWLTQRTFERWGLRLHDLAAKSYRSLQETLGLTKVIKVSGRESFFERSFATLRSSMSVVTARRAALASLPRLALETVFVVAVASVVAVTFATTESAVAWFAFVGFSAYAGLRILPSVHLSVFHLNNVRSGRAVIDDLWRDWSELVTPLAAAASSSRDPSFTFDREIAVDDVSFSYADEARLTLRHVSLTIAKGESIGIIGRTGSGKSTLVDLLLGLHEPSSGAIRVDGRDVRQAARAWQRHVGYVPQVAALLDDTLRRNIALGIEDGEIDERQVEEAVRLARLEELIEQLPRGLDTVTGERGVRLSGGERQRVAIARALYHRPAVLVFDEATAALDRRTESELQAGIDALRRAKTLIVIAHRLETVRGCDRVFLLRDGETRRFGAARGADRSRSGSGAADGVDVSARLSASRPSRVGSAPRRRSSPRARSRADPAWCGPLSG